MTAMPPVVSPAAWQAARDDLLVKEKALTRALDALAAERRRLPMVEVDAGYLFDTPAGKRTLLDLFEGRRQLVIYHFMLAPGGDACPGCSSFTDNVGRLEHLHARDTTYTLVARAPLGEIEAYRARMEWTVPWVSSYGTDFNEAMGVSRDGQENFGLSAFLRDDDGHVFRTYFTTSRGADRLRFDFNVLDLTPYGRQETWEESPAGWPQTEPYVWWRRHDEYGQ